MRRMPDGDAGFPGSPGGGGGGTGTASRRRPPPRRWSPAVCWTPGMLPDAQALHPAQGGGKSRCSERATCLRSGRVARQLSGPSWPGRGEKSGCGRAEVSNMRLGGVS